MLIVFTWVDLANAQDISDKNLNKKQKLEDFYRSELRKGTLSDERRADYTKKLEELRVEIKEIRDQNISWTQDYPGNMIILKSRKSWKQDHPKGGATQGGTTETVRTPGDPVVRMA